MRNSNIVASILMLVIAAILWPQMKGLTYFGIVFPRAVIAALAAAAVLLLLLTLARRDAGKADIESGSIQRFSMQVHPTSIAYRPELVTPKPRTMGPQTAVGVAPPGEESGSTRKAAAKCTT